MRYACVVFGSAVLLSLPYSFAYSEDSASSTLIVTTKGDNVELTVPASRLVVSFPRGEMVQADAPSTGATASPRYFQFSDLKKGLVVSGWFESGSSWAGFEKFVVSELLAMKKSGFMPKKAPEVVVAGDWQAFSYDIDLPKGISANVRAELISAGTWVDVHISVSSLGSPSDAREQAVQFLKSIVVKEKS